MKTAQAVAWAPGHITGFFEICDDAADIPHRGSAGAGISLASGCVTRVLIRGDSPAETSLDSFPVSRKVIELFHGKTGISIPAGTEVSHESALPSGAGFGSSGAGVLSLALALNAFSGSPLTQTQAAGIAHEAEVLCGTGLGTVLGDMVGGLEARTKAGAPGTGEVRAFPQPGGLLVMACVFGPLSTKKALSDEKTRSNINKAGTRCLDFFLKNPEPENLMSLARDFAENTGLISPRVRKLLDLADKEKLQASMTMFGEAVYVIINVNLRSRVLELFSGSEVPHTIFESEIAAKGAYVIDET